MDGSQTTDSRYIRIWHLLDICWWVEQAKWNSWWVLYQAAIKKVQQQNHFLKEDTAVRYFLREMHWTRWKSLEPWDKTPRGEKMILWGTGWEIWSRSQWWLAYLATDYQLNYSHKPKWIWNYMKTDLNNDLLNNINLTFIHPVENYQCRVCHQPFYFKSYLFSLFPIINLFSPHLFFHLFSELQNCAAVFHMHFFMLAGHM